MLKTDRLLLRAFQESDYEATRAFRSDPLVMQYITGEPETTDEVHAFLQRTQEHARQQPQSQFRFAIVLQTTRMVIGGCGLDILNSTGREGEIGYHLLPSYWGQGVATEVARALLQFGFETLNLHRIVADCVAQNPASARVMAKAGMQQEAHLRQNKNISGVWHDTLVYAILEHEWQPFQGRMQRGSTPKRDCGGKVAP